MATSAAPAIIGPQGLPSPQSALVDADGRLEPVWFRFFQSLWERTGAALGTDARVISQTIVNQSDDLDGLQGLLALGAPIGAPEPPAGPPDHLMPPTPVPDSYGIAMLLGG